MAEAAKKVERWSRSVLEAEGLGDWTIVYGEPYCWMGSKRIMVYPSTGHVGFLHEVAHALYPFPETLDKGQHFHGSQWGSAFGRLVDKYMKLKKPGKVGDAPVELPGA